MAYKKKVATNSGYHAEYWRLTEWSVNRVRQGGEALATFRVYRDKDSALASAMPASHQVAKLKLTGEDFATVFGPSRDETKTDQALLYEAADKIGVICDFGSDIFQTAQDA